jgi:hypothetical protein
LQVSRADERQPPAGQVLLDIAEPMLVRGGACRQAGLLDDVLLAASTDPAVSIEALCRERVYPCFRGACRMCSTGIIERPPDKRRGGRRLTADCPLIDGSYRQVVTAFFGGIAPAAKGKRICPGILLRTGCHRLEAHFPSGWMLKCAHFRR